MFEQPRNALVNLNVREEHIQQDDLIAEEHLGFSEDVLEMQSTQSLLEPVHLLQALEVPGRREEEGRLRERAFCSSTYRRPRDARSVLRRS